MNDILKAGSLGESENFNFLDNVVEAMNNLEPKKKYQTKPELILKSNSQVVFGSERKNTEPLIQPQNSSINLLEKPRLGAGKGLVRDAGGDQGRARGRERDWSNGRAQRVRVGRAGVRGKALFVSESKAGEARGAERGRVSEEEEENENFFAGGGLGKGQPVYPD